MLATTDAIKKTHENPSQNTPVHHGWCSLQMTRILSIFLLLTLPVLVSWAQSVKLIWTPSTSSDVTNYNLYWGTNGSRVYQSVIPVGTNLTATLSNMLPAHYWFAPEACWKESPSSLFQ